MIPALCTLKERKSSHRLIFSGVNFCTDVNILLKLICFSFSFEEFLKEEWTCRQEITAYEKKIENWSLAVKTNPKLPAAPTVRVCLCLVFLLSELSLVFVS